MGQNLPRNQFKERSFCHYLLAFHCWRQTWRECGYLTFILGLFISRSSNLDIILLCYFVHSNSASSMVCVTSSVAQRRDIFSSCFYRRLIFCSSSQCFRAVSPSVSEDHFLFRRVTLSLSGITSTLRSLTRSMWSLLTRLLEHLPNSSFDFQENNCGLSPQVPHSGSS